MNFVSEMICCAVGEMITNTTLVLFGWNLTQSEVGLVIEFVMDVHFVITIRKR